MRENCTPGSVRGVPGNRYPYRDARQAKLGASCRVEVPTGKGLTTHPYRVLRLWRSSGWSGMNKTGEAYTEYPVGRKGDRTPLSAGTAPKTCLL